MARVFIACRGAGVIEVRAPGGGQRQVGFQDTALDLFEQLFAQGRLVGQAGLLVGVFGLQVLEHLRGVALLQPGVRVGGLVLAGDGGLERVGHRGSLGWGAPARGKVFIIGNSLPGLHDHHDRERLYPRLGPLRCCCPGLSLGGFQTHWLDVALAA
ncbi:hypothetical protein D3C75_1019140 [compost metagenome]